MSKRWRNRPEGANWGEFGEDDQIGRLNLMDEAKVLQGAVEIRVGKTFCLSLPLDYPGGNLLSPVRFPPQLRPVIRNDEPYYNYEWRKKNLKLTDIASDDAVLLHTQYSTQWDSLAHRGSLFDADGDGDPEPLYYNGFMAGSDIALADDNTSFAAALGIEQMAVHGVQGRGVMVDLFSHCGEFPRREVGYDELMGILETDGVQVEKGDVLCLWTGLDRMILRMNKQPDASLKEACAVLDGHDKRLLQWISDSGIAAIASDNLAVENVGKAVPDCCTTTLPLHEHCLFKLGIHLGELWHLAELAQWLKANGRSRFMLTAPPLRLTGAVGSPVTPIATV
ncbi:cyclase family protein [Halomonas campisalis]|uniref:Cyclase family protein n=1 Tax=Billgrantia campisalis TaxID=74661 RepID=A0ABS9P3I0_9GAMM|nr:cyclase family protein [Halomonas campisalis]MCG6656338.1 cyclase family protein [Halomonas campisalis]MDR5861523.1 cyclase family protein [Halomonas campisalis]